jgi:hypothetical protein
LGVGRAHRGVRTTADSSAVGPPAPRPMTDTILTPAFPPSMRDQLRFAARDVRARVRHHVRAGFLSPAAVVDAALEPESKPFRRRLRSHAERAVEAAVDRHRSASRLWPSTTDCDRLDAAFQDLLAARILARQNYTCCSTCGLYSLNQELESADAGAVRGYVFYHAQSTDAAIEGNGLWLLYGGGGAVADDEATRLIGQEVVDALRRRRLDPEWSGDPQDRIHLPLRWRRRLPA